MYKIFLAIFLLSLCSFAQTNEQVMKGSHGLTINLGLYNDVDIANEVKIGGIATTNGSVGFLGSLEYSYWFNDEFLFTLSGGAVLISVENKVDSTSFNPNVSSEIASMYPVLAGLKVYPFNVFTDSPVLPYFGIAAGVYIGSYSRQIVTTSTVLSESIVELSFGGKISGGVDFLISSSFKLGLGAGYNFISEFDRAVGSETKYSGPEFTLAIGFVF